MERIVLGGKTVGVLLLLLLLLDEGVTDTPPTDTLPPVPSRSIIVSSRFVPITAGHSTSMVKVGEVLPELVQLPEICVHVDGMLSPEVTTTVEPIMIETVHVPPLDLAQRETV